MVNRWYIGLTLKNHCVIVERQEVLPLVVIFRRNDESARQSKMV